MTSRLRIARMAHTTPPEPERAGVDPELGRFLTDLVAPYRLVAHVTHKPDTYADLGERLLHAIGPLDAPVDLVVIAHAVPETDPRRSAAHHVSRLCPGRPVTFAICDQGTAAPFTALSVIREYGCTRALLLILEQGAPPYECPDRTPDRATAVALLLDAAGPAVVTAVRQHTEVGPAEVGPLVSKELARHPRAVLVLGSGAGRHVHQAPADEVRIAPAGQICTAVWSELAAGLVGWTRAGRPVLVAEYDPALRYLSLLAVEPQPRPGGR